VSKRRKYGIAFAINTDFPTTRAVTVASKLLGLERGDEAPGHRGPGDVIPLDWDNHGAIIGLEDGEPGDLRNVETID
jgi:hypothetical protein